MRYYEDEKNERTIAETIAMAMNDQDIQLIAEAAVAAANALDRQHGVFEFGTIRPDRFPSSSYQNWRDWRKHFAWIADANRWDDEQPRMVQPTCLTGWALDEFTSMPAHFREEVDGFEKPKLGRMLAELDQRMMPFQTQSAARAGFKNLMQEEGEGLRAFARRVRSLGEVANTNLGAQARDDMNREQFIDGLCASGIASARRPREFKRGGGPSTGARYGTQNSQDEESETAKSHSVGARCSRPDD